MANKTRRLISLSQNIDEKLDSINASSLIEELLEGHFNYINSNDLDLLVKKREEIADRISVESHRLDNINKRINNINEQTEQNVQSQEKELRLSKYKKYLRELMYRDINYSFDTSTEERKKIEALKEVPESWEEEQLNELLATPNPKKEEYLKRKEAQTKLREEQNNGI